MFKKLIQATLATALVATPLVATAAEAQVQQTTTVRERPNGTVVQTTVRTPTNRAVINRVTTRRWAKGQRFDRRYAPRYAVVDWRRYRARRLYAPPRGYQWVRSGNDAVLVGIASGLVAASLFGALN